jgi:site-specific DNA-methyltransferase (adenine-specific)
MWIELKRICKSDCIYIFFCTTKFGYKLIQSNEKWFRYDLVWEKSRKLGFLHANKMPLRKHEMIYVFANHTKLTYNPQKTAGKPYIRDREDCWNIYGKVKKVSTDNKGDRHPTTILKFNNHVKALHRTQKPVDLCEWLIKTYSNESDNVLDFTMGSGTTGVACINTNRNFIGVEMDEKIFKVARHRLFKHELEKFKSTVYT